MKPLINNIIVAVSGTDTSILAAKYAIVMSKQYQCKLTAVYIIDTATIKMLTLNKIFLQEEGNDYEKSLEKNGNRYLTFVEELASAKGVKIDKVIRKGAVSTEILGIADEKKADLILLGYWEKDNKPNHIFGHSHREIVANSKCSVMLVKEPDIELIYKKI
jgi:nucleotide-binding universal stress UspA family protein